MPLKIRCSKCGKDFTPSREDARNIRLSGEQMLHLIRVDCPHCGSYSNCRSLMSAGKKATLPRAPSDLNYRCPELGCTGWVCQVEDSWGCGECGSVWQKQKALWADITEIVERFEYRKASYTKTKTGWKPGPEGAEDTQYETKVEAELHEKAQKKRRK